MVTGLVDSSIIIDMMRNYEPSFAWVATQNGLGITYIVWLELLQGVKNKVERQRSLAVLKGFTLIEITHDDMQWAVNQLIHHKLSHNVDAFDCLIASVSMRLKLPLYTRNLKHFIPLIGDLAVSPY